MSAQIGSRSALTDWASCQAMLHRWADLGWLRVVDRTFADFLASQCAGADPLVVFSAALASHQLGRGHVCLDLAATLADSRFVLSMPPEGAIEEGGAVLPSSLLAGLDLPAWQGRLTASPLVAGGSGNSPLVLAGGRLYLRRYWQYEQEVRRAIDDRLERNARLQDSLPLDRLRSTLDLLFPNSSITEGPDGQKLACALAARSAFSLITGGPGTGKTTTVVRLLALLQSLALNAEVPRPFRIRLAAPTGKAAARLNESIAGAVSRLRLDGIEAAEQVRAAIPTEVTTLHRLLGTRPDSRRFRHDRRRPLSVDVLVIDEASMVDLEMMAAVLAALPESARLILLGDKDQLASVEAGAVLGELCRRARSGHYWPDTVSWLAAASGEVVTPTLVDVEGLPLDQAVAMLRQSHRFSRDSGIGRLADRVNEGNVSGINTVLDEAPADVSLLLLGDEDARFRELVINGAAGNFPNFGEGRQMDGRSPLAPVGYRHFLETISGDQPREGASAAEYDQWARAVLSAHGRFQLLCALRQGPWGVTGLNVRVAEILVKAGLITSREGWYLGRPVLVTRNDYALGLMNGDVGITLLAPPQVRSTAVGQSPLRVAFASGDGTDGIRWVLPSRLQAVETAYALTVHKSQGSEFGHAALLIPKRVSPILTRELVYTGITRARHWLTLACASGNREVLIQACQRRVQRASGLLADASSDDGSNATRAR